MIKKINLWINKLKTKDRNLKIIKIDNLCIKFK